MYKAASNTDSVSQEAKKEMWKDFIAFHTKGIIPSRIIRVTHESAERVRSITSFDPSIITRRNDVTK